MIEAGPTRHYRLFDRILESPLEISLLQEMKVVAAGRRPPVSLRLSSLPIIPEGEVSFGGEEWPLTYYSGSRADYADFHGTGQIAAIDKSGTEVTVHPRAETSDSLSPESSRRVVDSLVTTVFSRIPILWGTPPIHGATLRSPQGTILLLGESGHGKSTLSQILQRDYSWLILDDDTATLQTDAEEPYLVPMGAAARLRKDAASHLSIKGAQLPGYAGGKVFIPTDPPVESSHQATTLPLFAIFKLVPETNSLYVEKVDPVDALAATWDAVFTSDASLHQRRLRFRASSQLANYPLFKVHYAKGSHSPESVARVLVHQISQLPRMSRALGS